MIDSGDEARVVVQHWLDATMDGPAGRFRVITVADVGPAWRALFDMPSDPDWVSFAHVDKASEIVAMGWDPTLKVGRSAREGYVEMMRTKIRPELHRLGLTSSGGLFTLPTPDHFASISFQQSQGNFWFRARFTANVQVIPHGAWATYTADRGFGDRPHPDVGYPIAWHRRLGEFNHGHDYWWTVWAGFPTDDVAADLISALRDHALPAMRQQIAGPSAR